VTSHGACESLKVSAPSSGSETQLIRRLKTRFSSFMIIDYVVNLN